MGYTFMVPAKIISGVNVISELGDHIAGKGTKALIVTDQFMVKGGLESLSRRELLLHHCTRRRLTNGHR